MPDICFITTCMGRLDHLRQSLPLAAAQPNAQCVVVDYSCPQKCGDWVEAHFPHCQVVRVPERKLFHLAHARNAGAKAANAPWLCFLDADVALDPAFTPTILPRIRDGHFYRLLPFRKELAGVCVCRKSDFDAVEGYDEVMQGWGREDIDLYWRMGFHGVKEDSLLAELARPLSHGDELRVQHYAESDLNRMWSINRFYVQVKWDAMRFKGEPLSEAKRTIIYAKVTEAIADLRSSGRREARVSIMVSRQPTIEGGEVEGHLVYVWKEPIANAG